MIRIISLTILSSFLTFAQFGKNKVQYERFDWQFISTDHFDIYFHQGGEYLARFCAVELEKSLVHIENQLDYELQPDPRIPVIVFNSHNQFQQNNAIDQFFSEAVGGVTELFKNRIIMPFQGSYSQFSHLIAHELVHAVFNDMFHGGNLRTSISQNGFFMPTWMNEGFAEFSSIKGLDTETDMFMRDLTLNDNLPELGQISGYLSYRAGQTFYWYVAKEYGEEKVGELINRMRSYASVEAAFQASFKMSLEDFSEKWKRDIKKLYLPDISIFDNPKDYAIEVTNREEMMNFYNSSPAISPNGERMAFISEDGGLLGISVMDIDDMDSRRELISSFRSQDFEDLNILTPGISWNPSGKFIAVSAKAGGEDAIYIINEESGKYDKIKLGFKSIGSVQWSPDGKKICFTATDKEFGDIYTYELQTKKVERITSDLFTDEMPVWSPDSRSVYFISDRQSNLPGSYKNFKNMWTYNYTKKAIYKVNIVTKDIKRISKTNLNDVTSLAVGPNEEKILFVSDMNGISNLYSLDLKSNKITPKTNSLTGLNHISLSPDGSKLLFGTQINAGYDIFLLKYPFQIDLGFDDLPKTTYMKGLKSEDDESQKILEEISEIEKEDELISYGTFELNLEDNELVEPNLEAQTYDLSSPEVKIDIDTNFVVQDYKVKFSTDLIYGSPGFNTFFGAQGATQFLFSDVMGDHKIQAAANFFLDLNNSSAFLQYSYLPDIIDYNAFAFHSAGFSQILTGEQFNLYRFRDFGVGGGASYPFDLFNRLDFSAQIKNISRENISIPNFPTESNLLFVPELKFVHDNALGGPWAPSIGSRYYFRFMTSPQIGSTGLGFSLFDFDIRKYQPIVEGWLNLAVRLSGGTSFGNDALTFRVGGVENWINVPNLQNLQPFVEPQDFAFMLFAWPMRGWEINEVQGNNFFLTNLELRFPLFQAILAGPIPVMIRGVQGSFFLDVGSAWNDGIGDFNNTIATPGDRGQIEGLLTSTGVGIRSALLGLPLKIDIAWRMEPNGWSRPVYLFSFGFDF